ncbi:hypothetical protein TNIN_3191 [Trichonephila inaurata madagascariensis]|uniref:Uncharacterized protein n=1 Tax=Trichonephila inaurata madagascariensis TaxID=2747483 RepID=A0A8X6XQG2_9ARAC|nr:hypothetical protein TNIN_3191 [Trichonephila inaurata madagascariensis]
MNWRLQTNLRTPHHTRPRAGFLPAGLLVLRRAQRTFQTHHHLPRVLQRKGAHQPKSVVSRQAERPERSATVRGLRLQLTSTLSGTHLPAGLPEDLFYRAIFAVSRSWGGRLPPLHSPI